MMSSRLGSRRITRIKKRFVDKYDKKYLWVMSFMKMKEEKIELGWLKKLKEYFFNIFWDDEKF